MNRKSKRSLVLLFCTLTFIGYFASACAQKTTQKKKPALSEVQLQTKREVFRPVVKKQLTEEDKIAISIDQRAQELIESGVVSKIQSQKIPSQRYNGVLINEDEYKTYNILIFGPSPYFSNACKYEIIPQTIVYVKLPPGFYHWRTFNDKELVDRGTMRVGTTSGNFNKRNEYLGQGYRELNEQGNEYTSHRALTTHFQAGHFKSGIVPAISQNKQKKEPKRYMGIIANLNNRRRYQFNFSGPEKRSYYLGPGEVRHEYLLPGKYLVQLHYSNGKTNTVEITSEPLGGKIFLGEKCHWYVYIE